MAYKIWLLVLFLQVALLPENGDATFHLFRKGFFQKALKRISRAPICLPSRKSLPSFTDLLEYRTCLKPVPWVNGTRKHPEQDLRTHQVFQKYGYNVATYNNITTEDGYILTVDRVTGSQVSPTRNGKPAVLLLHGVGTGSEEWVLQHEERKNLPMKLVNAGFEVWLANFRGTLASRGHVKYNSQWDTKYWDFTFHEMGVYDIPALVDTVLLESGNDRVFIIGHNYAANAYAAAMAERPELNDYVEAAVFLGPSVFMGHVNNPLRPLFRAAMEMDPFFQTQVNNAMRGKLQFGNWMMNPLLARFCTPTALKCGVCSNLHFFLYGFDAPQVTFNDIPNIVSKTPNSISFKTALHLGQLIKSCDFRKYDYGKIGNTRAYGQDNAPSYNLTKLTAPIYIYYGGADNLATIEDVIQFRNALPEGTLQQISRVSWKLFNNADFMIAKDAEGLVYNQIMDNLKETLIKRANRKPNKIATSKKPGATPSVHVFYNNETDKKPDAVVMTTAAAAVPSPSSTAQPVRNLQRFTSTLSQQESASRLPSSRAIAADVPA